MSKENKVLLDTLIAALPARVLVIDHSGRCTRAFEADDAELVGKPIADILPTRVVARLQEALQAALEDGTTQIMEYHIPAGHRDGGDRWFEARLAPVPGRREALWLLEDISERKRLERELEESSLIDPLTEVSNQRHFMRVLDQEIARQKRYQEPFCLLLLEVDHYETVRENYGRESADMCLQEIARLIRQQLRHSDVLGRLEDAEFGVLLLNTPLVAAKEVAERIRARIAHTPLTLPKRTLRLSVSGGVTALRSGDTASSLLWRSEEALFKSESSGQSSIHVG